LLGSTLGKSAFLDGDLFLLLAFPLVVLRPGLGCAARVCSGASCFGRCGFFLALAFAGVGFGLRCGGALCFLGSTLGK
jgi:hypothetical protein